MIAVGDTFGRLETIELVRKPFSDRFRYVWKCCCQCGSEVYIQPTALKRGATQSCGCLRSELLVERQTKHGHSARGRWSGTYSTWSGMIARCLNPKHRSWKYYGALGVKVCKQWQGEDGFQNFLKDMGEKPNGRSLDRINPFGHYEPANCRWSDNLTQANNKRYHFIMAQFNFNAGDYAPQFAGGSQLPPGKHPVMIVESELVLTKDKTGGNMRFVLEAIDGPAKGQTQQLFLMLQSNDPKNEGVVKSNHQRLSAICYVTGIYRFQNTEELHRRPFVVEVGPQRNQPEMMEVKEVFSSDMRKASEVLQSGNAPGAASGPAPTPPAEQGQQTGSTNGAATAGNQTGTAGASPSEGWGNGGAGANQSQEAGSPASGSAQQWAAGNTGAPQGQGGGWGQPQGGAAAPWGNGAS